MASPCISFHSIVIIHMLSLTSCTHAHRFIPDKPAGCFHVNAYAKDSCQVINNRSALKMYIFDYMQTFVRILFFYRLLVFICSFILYFLVSSLYLRYSIDVSLSSVFSLPRNMTWLHRCYVKKNLWNYYSIGKKYRV